MIRILGTIFAGLLGLAFGSFLNVCLSRWPEGESIVQPRSHCRHCSHTLAWWENVPLLSWLALRGRCRNCRAWIGWRYPLVELAIGGLWTQAVWQTMAPSFVRDRFSSSPEIILIYLIGTLALLWLLVALAVLDLQHLWLPDWLTLPGAALGFIAIFSQVKLNSDTVLSYYGALSMQRRFLYHFVFHWLLGILAAAALILLIRWVYWLIRRREGIGLGDAKLMALLAAWLGLPGALLAFGLGVVIGALIAAVLLAIPAARINPNSWALQKLPLGTFLCIGGVVSALWGQPIMNAYLHWAGF